MSQLTFDADNHTYTIGGTNVPSVTEIVSLLTSSKLNEINHSVLNTAAARGTAVHEITELIDYGVPLEDIEIDPAIAGYVKAYLDFLRDYRPEWKMIEQPVCNEVQGYAGTLDRMGTIDGCETIVDIKTVASASRVNKIAWAVQTEGYRRCVTRVYIRRKILQLKANGKYTLHDAWDMEDKYNFDSELLFDSLLTLTKLIGDYKWKNL